MRKFISSMFEGIMIAFCIPFIALGWFMLKTTTLIRIPAYFFMLQFDNAKKEAKNLFKLKIKK